MIIQESFVDARGRARHRFSRECPVCGATMPGYRPLLLGDVDQISKSLPEHNLFFFDRVSPGNLQLARRSRAQGALVFFEPSGIGDEEMFVECVRVAHVLKYSHERLSDLDAPLKGSTVELEIETQGERGLRFRTRKGARIGAWHSLAALEAPSVVDTAGSGDWCTAGLMERIGSHRNAVAALGDIEEIKEALRFGQALAALNCGYEGARGLMYVATRSAVLKTVEKLLADEVAKLPTSRTSEPDASKPCVVCSSVLEAAHG